METNDHLPMITVNLGTNMNNTISIIQYTSGQTLDFNLSDYVMPNNASATILVQKPSGHECLYTNLEYDGNHIYCPVTLQMTAEVGDSIGEIQIYQNGKYLFTYQFTLNITANIFPGIGVESSDDFSALGALLIAANTLLGQAAQAEEDRADAEALRVAAEALRVSAENLRQTAEQTRIANEALRDSAEDGRILAELRRQSDNTTNIVYKGTTYAPVEGEQYRQAQEAARLSAETTRISNETSRENYWNNNVATFLSNYQNLMARIEGLENPADEYVPLHASYITRPDGNSSGTITYDASVGGFIISFS